MSAIATSHWDTVFQARKEPVYLDIASLGTEPEDVYHAKSGEYLSSHLLSEFIACPYGYRRMAAKMYERKDTTAFLIGRAAHKLILEGADAFEATYATGGPVNPKTGESYGQGTKAYAEWERASGKTGLTTDQNFTLTAMFAAVVRNSEATQLLNRGAGLPERVVRTTYLDVPCQIRIDWLRRDCGIVDLKTCDDLTWFEADARRYNYLRQIAFYQLILEAATGKRMDCHIIAVEKKEPFRCGVWKMDADSLAATRKEIVAAIERLKLCRMRDEWPTGYEDARVMAL